MKKKIETNYRSLDLSGGGESGIERLDDGGSLTRVHADDAGLVLDIGGEGGVREHGEDGEGGDEEVRELHV